MIYSYLALGDSYTVGEQLNIRQSFPYQTVQLLRKKGFDFYAPEIIATTGWTTDELMEGIDHTVFLPKYDFVTLLIGVNNQYRGREARLFEVELEDLVQRAIEYAGNNADQVFVLSIPDWGVTPFAKDRDTTKIAAEIDAFNAVCEAMAKKYLTHFIDINTSYREDGGKLDYVADDQLHPNGKAYTKWATTLSDKIAEIIKNKSH